MKIKKNKKKYEIKKNECTTIQSKTDFSWYYSDNKNSHKTNVFKRSDLPPGFKFKDTAIIVQEDATTLIPTDCELYVDDQLNLVIRTN